MAANQQDRVADGMANLQLQEAGQQQAAGAGKKERGPPALRSKRSQRFTVNATPAAAPDAPPVPNLPTLNPPHQAHPDHGLSTPALDRTASASSYSVSSVSDTDSNPDFPSHHHGQQHKFAASTLNPLAAPVQPFQSQSYHAGQQAQGAVPYMTPPSSRGKAAGAAGLTGYAQPPQQQGRPGIPGSWMEGQGMPQPQPYVQPPAIMGAEDEEVIPTAIVVKNIPFSVRREQLLAIIEDLSIPAPYAFNYHFDNGIFRGLAFANFRSPSEADAAVAGLNGFDIQGRKLRVEYKKVLQAGEKERIEKEKAIKRMRSMQMSKEEYAGAPAPGGFIRSREPSFNGEEEDYGTAMPPNQYAYQASPIATPVRNLTAPPNMFLSPSEGSDDASLFGGAGTGSAGSPPEKVGKDLDMNDPHTLEIYSRVLLFKDDNMRDELAFARSLSASQRRVVHQVAKKLGLDHKSEGVGEDRHVVVMKGGSAGDGRKSRNATLGRSGGGGYLATPEHGGLRGKKSMPDMRNGGGYLDPSAQHTRSLGRRSNANLREGYSTTGRKASSGRGDAQSLFGSHPFQPAPPLPGMTFGAEGDSYGNGNGFGGMGPPSPSPLGSVVRQPRGPVEGVGKGFGEKMRNARLMPGQAAGVGEGQGEA